MQTGTRPLTRLNPPWQKLFGSLVKQGSWSAYSWSLSPCSFNLLGRYSFLSCVPTSHLISSLFFSTISWNTSGTLQHLWRLESSCWCFSFSPSSLETSPLTFSNPLASTLVYSSFIKHFLLYVVNSFLFQPCVSYLLWSSLVTLSCYVLHLQVMLPLASWSHSPLLTTTVFKKLWSWVSYSSELLSHSSCPFLIPFTSLDHLLLLGLWLYFFWTQ